MASGWTKAEKTAKRRELAAWISLKREQLGSQIRTLRAELAQQIAAKRQRLTQEMRGARKMFPASQSVTARELEERRLTQPGRKLFETEEEYARMRPKRKRAAPKKRAAPAKKKARRARRR